MTGLTQTMIQCQMTAIPPTGICYRLTAVMQYMMMAFLYQPIAEVTRNGDFSASYSAQKSPNNFDCTQCS